MLMAGYKRQNTENTEYTEKGKSLQNILKTLLIMFVFITISSIDYKHFPNSQIKQLTSH